MNIFARREVRAIEQARHILQDEVRTELATITNEFQAMTERWNFINQRLDRLEVLLREKVVVEQ